MENVSDTEPVVDERPTPRAYTLNAAQARVVYLLAGAGVIGLVIWWLQFSTPAICCGDLDGYYHIKWSQMLWQGLRTRHFPPRFTWLPLTTLNPRDYVDHHLLFHIIEIPFTFFRDLRLGAKVSAALFAGLALFSCYWLTFRYRLRYPFVWLLALLGCSAPFLYRMNMTKAMSLSIVLLVIGINLLFQRKYLWLLPLAFVFTETYDMFVLLGVAVAIWVGVEGWSERRFAWQPVLLTAVGIVAGLIINPYFPHNIKLLTEHVLMKATQSDFTVKVGNEWYPYDSWDFVRNSAVACVAMVVGYIAFRWEDRKQAARPLFFLIFSSVLLVANARYRRFAEYWPPFAILFAAFAVQALLERARAGVSAPPPDVLGELNELQPYFDAYESPAERAAAKRREEWGLIMATVVGLMLCTSMAFTVYAERNEIKSSAPPDEYRAGLEWLRNNVPAGEVVFNTDWDDFPKLFYYDPTHAYVSGLDPTYLYDANHDLSNLYDQITLGKQSDPGPLIRDRFGARYVFTDNEDVHDAFYNAALDSGWFDEVYTDDSCTILHIRDEKGPPPADKEEKGNDSAQPDEQNSNDENDEGDDNSDNDEGLLLRPPAGGRIA
jgi:hypothetical protein